MNESFATLTCDHCQTRLRVKPGLLKVMKTIKCSKCGRPVAVTNVILPPAEEPRQETPTAPEAAPPAVAAPDVIPPNDAVPSTKVEEPAAASPDQLKDEELASLRAKLRAAEQELAESDARISDLQEQWHSKEIEIREMAARLKHAEEESRRALALRDEFLAKAKNELAIYLVGERDSALSRFSELEKRLIQLQPGKKTP